MKPKISVFIATSVDGYIARKDGGLDWLNNANAAAPAGEDCGYHAFMATVDALVMGRNTFEQVLTFGQWPYGKTKVIVLSSKQLIIPVHLRETVFASSESPADLTRRLADEGVKHMYVDGGLTVQSFLRERLVDEITITLVPVILGEGKSLFGPVGKDVILKHLETKSYDFGYVQLRYAL